MGVPMYGLVLCVLISHLQLGTAQQAYQQRALNLHNRYRAKHHAPALGNDNGLNDAAVKCARWYAEQRTINHKCPHKGNAGENLAAGSGGNWSADQFADMSTNMWYDEEKKYDYNNPGFSSATGHFTQVVWKNSQKFGFGYAKVGDYTVGVGLYSPPGNYNNQYRENVLRP